MMRIWDQVFEYNPEGVCSACQCPQLHAPIVVTSTRSKDSPYSHIYIEHDEQSYSNKCGSGQTLTRLPLRLLGLGDGIGAVATHDVMSTEYGLHICNLSVELRETLWKGKNDQAKLVARYRR